MFVRLQQSLKHESESERLYGIIMLVRDIQYSKTLFPIEFKLLGRVISVKEVHEWNEYSPIVMIEFGRWIYIKLEQLLKQFEPIYFTFVRLTSVIVVHDSNEESPIVWREKGKYKFVSFTQE